MSFLPRRYLRSPRFYLHTKSRLIHLLLTLLIVILLDAYWTIAHIALPVRTIAHISLPARTTTLSYSSDPVAPSPSSPGTPIPKTSEYDSNPNVPSKSSAPNNETIFIAAMFRNSEYMLRTNWSTALLSLARHLGPQNVYVSIQESGSQDQTKEALVELDGALGDLGVERTIGLGVDVQAQLAELHSPPGEGEDRSGWIFTGRTKENDSGWERRRIPHLADLRNKVMEPLLQVWDDGRGKKFDKILWINDVVFTTEDVMTLLSTNAGSYAAACSLDFSRPDIYYDTFALRDSLGYKTTSLSWPYFYSPQSLSALRANLPVPVKSCWNGMVVFDSEPFYPSSDITPLKFRGTADSLAEKHVEGSECCLIHADNVLRESRGVFVNPNVRTAYSSETYEGVNAKDKRGRGRWPRNSEAVEGIWKWRWRRFGYLMSMWSERWVMESRVRDWKLEGKEGEKRGEEGMECLINEMQVLYENGWQHV